MSEGVLEEKHRNATTHIHWKVALSGGRARC
jgi:hypothetical protein